MILVRGDKGADVARWQRVLVEAKNRPTAWITSTGATRSWPSTWPWPIATDGDFGQMTEWATQAWQASNGFVVDGVVSDDMWTVAGEAVPVSHREQLVPTVQTPVSMADYACAAVRAWPSLGGTELPSQRAVAVLWAQYMIETGGKACWNWNIGNVKHVAGDGFDYVALNGVWEMINGKRVDLAPTDPGAWFRAFDSLEHAMGEHLKLLATKRYASAWPHVLAGDVNAFAAELHRNGYFTAAPEAYAAGMRGPFDAFMRSTAFDDAIAAALPLDTSTFVEVECNGVRWLVAPVYIAPVGIGEAATIARRRGCELPSPELVDAIWRAADLKIDAATMVRAHDGTPATMDSETMHASQAERLAVAIGGRALGVDYRLLAGVFKDVVIKDGKLGLYGWHRLDGHPIQPFFAGHAPSWRDYSHGLRLCRRMI